MTRFEPLGEKVVARGWRINLVKARFRAPDGTIFERDVVRHPGAVAVVPVTEDGIVLLVKQYRAPLDAELLEIPAGTRDVDGEPPEATAARELAEEAGVEAANIELLGEILNSPGFCDESTFLYLATGLTPCAFARDGVEERHMEVVHVSLDEVGSMLGDGTLKDAQTVLGLLLARERLVRKAGHEP